ncbi:hypothetical protein OROHE_022150 [Orobanche hederae]
MGHSSYYFSSSSSSKVRPRSKYPQQSDWKITPSPRPEIRPDQNLLPQHRDSHPPRPKSICDRKIPQAKRPENNPITATRNPPHQSAPPPAAASVC